MEGQPLLLLFFCVYMRVLYPRAQKYIRAKVVFVITLFVDAQVAAYIYIYINICATHTVCVYYSMERTMRAA